MNFTPGSAANVSARVQLTISCKNLVDADVFSKSDPMVVVFANNSGHWSEFGRTETIWDNLNPEFAKHFIMEYHFEMQQKLRFEVYDIDSESRKLANHDFLGEAEATLGEIVSSGRLSRKLRHKTGKIWQGEILIRSEEIVNSRENFELALKFSGIKYGFMSSGKCFAEVRRATEDGSFVVVKRSEPMVGKEFIWNFVISGSALNNGDNERTLEISLWKFKSNGSHSVKGIFQTNGNDLKSTGKAWHMQDKLKCQIAKSLISTKYTFLDYLQGGMEMNFVVAIDFTASNGDPSRQDSLHYLSGNIPNQYEQAIRAVGDIIEDYDTDKLFPVYGFGARLPPEGKISHMFPCNFQPENPFMDRVEGVLSCYKNCLPRIQLYGPTNFAPIIREVARMARSPENIEKRVPDFFVLLIVTDGVITDMDATKQAIIENSNLPFSIIIVGVGGADFDAMEELDSDDSLLSFNGRRATRDIVQFVPYRLFLSSNSVESRLNLAREVLAEVPEQVTSFMAANKRMPVRASVRYNEAPPPYQ